jgi:hypothetical protein
MVHVLESIADIGRILPPFGVRVVCKRFNAEVAETQRTQRKPFDIAGKAREFCREGWEAVAG